MSNFQKNRISLLFILFLILMINFISFTFMVKFSTAFNSSEGYSIEFPITLNGEEKALDNGTLLNTDTFNFSLYSTDWNMTELNIFFKNISLDRETIIIEDGGNSFKSIDKKINGYGVQLNITKNIKLFGVYIYGYLDGNSFSDVYVQINGFDKINHIPNSTLYGSRVLLNISNVPMWYQQMFPEPILLKKGQYFLVLNGSGFLINDNSNYNWFLNEINSNNTKLYTAKLEKDVWSMIGQGSPFRHKLILRTNQIFNPRDINMTLEVKDQHYPIENGPKIGTGILNLTNINLSISQQSQIFPIKYNISKKIFFNLTYSVSLSKMIKLIGNLKIEPDHSNFWNFYLNISKYYENQTFKIQFPKRWFNISIFRNQQNITNLVKINKTLGIILLTNDVIIDHSKWEIQAHSNLINFGLNVLQEEYRPGQKVRFTLSEPVLPGQYTCIIYDPFGFEDMIITTFLPLDENLFEYNISTYAFEGSYKIIVFWTNHTDGGIATQEFMVNLPFSISPEDLLLILFLIFGSTGIMITSIIVSKKLVKKRRAKKEAILNYLRDILNLKYFMLVDKKSSLTIYDQIFTSDPIDTSLISGFLSAIKSFGIELTNSDAETQTIKLEYKNLKVIMTEFKSFRIILIMTESPSQAFIESLNKLALKIEEKYGIMLRNFKGEANKFVGITDLFRKYLKVSLLYPLELSSNIKIKLKLDEKEIVNLASKIMKNNNKNYFYISQIFEVKKSNIKNIKIIIDLIDKGIFNPIL